jgi:UDP-N-acetylmuramoyl-tripeptide--D-alanyl-D-alanine ligase
MKALHEALPQDKRGEWHPDSATLAARARKLLDAGDVVMVKGSLGSKMRQVVDAILKLGEAQPATIPGGLD